MSLFFVYVREDEENKPAMRTESYYGGNEPPEPVWCADIVQAESRGQAKHRFLQVWTGKTSNPVYHDDWPLLRVRLISHDESLDEDHRWQRVHEIVDHGNQPCDCEYAEQLAVTDEPYADGSGQPGYA